MGDFPKRNIDSRLRVIVPLRRESSPYLHLLYSNMEKRGIEVLHVKNPWSVDFLRKICVADILHLHWIEYLIKSYNLLLTLSKFLGILIVLSFVKMVGRKIVITLHNIQPHERIYPFLEGLWFKLALEIADGVIVHNHYSYKILARIYGLSKKVCVIPHGNFIDYYPNIVTPREARRKLGIPEGSFVLLFFGALREYKGIDDLITVLRNILPRYNALFVVFAGRVQSEKLRTDLLKFFREFKEKCIVKMEYVPVEEVQIYMNAADIGILPYKEVTTSGAVLLFQSFGKTVIAPYLPQIKEVLGDSGIYYKRGDKRDMETAILKSLTLGKEEIQLLGKKAYENALKMDWNRIAHLTSKFYTSVLRNSYPSNFQQTFLGLSDCK